VKCCRRRRPLRTVRAPVTARRRPRSRRTQRQRGRRASSAGARSATHWPAWVPRNATSVAAACPLRPQTTERAARFHFEPAGRPNPSAIDPRGETRNPCGHTFDSGLTLDPSQLPAAEHGLGVGSRGRARTRRLNGRTRVRKSKNSVARLLRSSAIGYRCRADWIWSECLMVRVSRPLAS
jgi:hypothetical protein